MFIKKADGRETRLFRTYDDWKGFAHFYVKKPPPGLSKIFLHLPYKEISEIVIFATFRLA